MPTVVGDTGSPGAELPAPSAPGGLILRNIATLGTGELLSRLIGFGATVYIARRLGVEAYGIVGFGFAVLLYATAIVDAGLEHTGPREVAAADEGLSELLSSLLIARLVWSVLVAAALLAALFLIFSGEERLVLGLYTLALIPVGINTRWAHVGLDRSALVSASRIFAELVRAGAILLLVRGPGDLSVVPLGQLAGDALAALLLLAGLRSSGIRLRLRVNWGLTRSVLRRSAPMAVSGLLAVMIYNVDLVFLRAFRDTTELGLYLAGYTLINFLGILGHVVALALLPTFTRLRTDSTALGRLFDNAMARVFAAGIPMAVGGFIVAPMLVTFVFGSDYDQSAVVLAILIWAMPVVLVRSVLQAALLAHSRQDQVLRTTFSAAITNVALNAVAVPLYGMYGAAVTTVIAEVVRLMVAYVYVRRAGLPATPALRFAHSMAAAMAMGVVLLMVAPRTLHVAIPLGIVSYFLALVLTGGFRLRAHGIEVRI